VALWTGPWSRISWTCALPKPGCRCGSCSPSGCTPCPSSSGITESGRQVVIDEDSAGLSKFVVNRAYVRPWLLGDTTAAPRLFAHLNQQRRDSLVEVRLSVDTYTITDSGTTVRRQTLTYEPGVTGAR
jgi:hypothetical protein